MDIIKRGKVNCTTFKIFLLRRDMIVRLAQLPPFCVSRGTEEHDRIITINASANSVLWSYKYRLQLNNIEETLNKITRRSMYIHSASVYQNTRFFLVQDTLH